MPRRGIVSHDAGLNTLQAVGGNGLVATVPTYLNTRITTDIVELDIEVSAWGVQKEEPNLVATTWTTWAGQAETNDLPTIGNG